MVCVPRLPPLGAYAHHTYGDIHMDNYLIWLAALDAMETMDRLRAIADKDPRDKVAQARYLLANVHFNRAVKNYDALRA